MTEHPPVNAQGEPQHERAEILRTGVPYVRGWAEARSAAVALAEELRALGMESAFAYLRADVNLNGEGFIRLDLVTSETAQRLANLLALGLCVELEQLPTRPHATDRTAPTA
jgi:hypothetical protein